MNQCRSIRFVLSGFLFLTLVQLAQARDELPNEVLDLFAKMNTAAQKPFAEIATRTHEHVDKRETKSMNWGSSTAVFIDPNRFQFQTDERSYQQINLIGNGEKCFAFSSSSSVPVMFDAAPKLDNFYVQKLYECQPNLAIAICGSSQAVLMPEQSEFVELKNDTLDDKSVIRLRIKKDNWHADYFIDTQTHRIVLKRSEYDRLKLPPDTIPSVGYLRFTSQREPTTEERTLTYTDEQHERAWKEAAVQTGIMAFPLSKVKRSPTAEMPKSAQELKPAAPATDPFSIGQTEVRTIVNEPGPVLITGDRAPDFEGADIDGNPIKLSDYKDKVVLLSFWYIGCKPCIKEMVHLKQLVNELRNPELVVLTINIDSADDHATVVDRVKRCMAHYELDFPTILDEEQKIWDLYNASVLPAAIIIGRDGIIRGTLDRWDEYSDEPIKAALAETK